MIKNLMVCGYGRHGKDQFCEFMGIPFKSSSEIALDIVIWPKWGRYIYANKQECFDDRHNNRQVWFGLIADMCKDDEAALGKVIFKDDPIYCGCRRKEEFEALRKGGHFDMSVWIDAGLRLPPEPSTSCTITPDMCNVVITNNGTLDEFERKVKEFKRVVGL